MEVVEDKGLLAEVAGLVEWPVVLMGQIEETFLSLPAEVLQTSMKEHQKFFSVRNPKSGRIERFVTVANIETEDDGATILAAIRRSCRRGCRMQSSFGRMTCALRGRGWTIGSSIWAK